MTTNDFRDAVKKVGVVTIIDYTNYGNRLQNYAVQQVVESFGFEAETIVNFARPRNAPANPGFVSTLTEKLKKEGVRSVTAFVLSKFKSATGAAREARRFAAYVRLRDLRETSFRAFTKAHIRETDFEVHLDSPLDHLDARYDFFVVGSDQIWNPDFRNGFALDFLGFAAPHKRVSLSASIGLSTVPEERRAFYREGLSGFTHIAVREEAAAGVVRELAGREALVTVDPTLLLTRTEWEALAAPHPLRPKTPYVLTYFVGKRTPEAERLTERYAARFGAVARLNDQESPDLYTADPAQFLGLVRDAAVVLTDSFHGVIFSVLMGAPFVTFGRVDRFASMNSRMETLLGTLRLEGRRFDEAMTEAERDALLDADYAHVAPILEAKRREARDYLARAFGAPAAGAAAP